MVFPFAAAPGGLRIGSRCVCELAHTRAAPIHHDRCKPKANSFSSDAQRGSRLLGFAGRYFGLYEPASPPVPGSLHQPGLASFSVSNREEQVAQLLVDGVSNKEIANALGIADVTVRLHLRRVFSETPCESF